MTISKARWILLGAAVFVAVNVVSAARAKDELPKAVRDVLSEEHQLSRSEWNRRQQLGEELLKAKNSAEELRWHAGFVKLNGKWMPFEDSIHRTAVTAKEREYLERRKQSEQTPQSQTKLAMWCSQEGLNEQSQAHYHRVLMLMPSDTDVTDLYRRMRYLRVGNKWLSRYEAEEARLEFRRYFDQLERWTPESLKWVEELDRGRLSERTRRLRIQEFAKDDRVPAVESVLGRHSESSATAAVETLAQTSTFRATQALGRMAIFSPWLFVRDRAIAELKERKLADYVPQWMSLTHAPLRTEFHNLSKGWDFGFAVLLIEERESEVLIAKTTVSVPGELYPQNTRRQPKGSPFGVGRLARLRELSRKAAELEEWARFIAQTPQPETELLNERISIGLNSIVGNSAGDRPQEWWSWWNQESGFAPVLVSDKKVVIVQEDNVTLPRTSSYGGSCLVAGTPIWTERGLVAVERIQTGDLVLAKNVETGELAYKVVRHTTVREPFPVTKFAIGDETIQATEGHHFWVSGRGWTKTRELAAEQPLHTAIGVTRIASTESVESAPTYNLVVADFHTYFVGKSAILSHDVLPPKPTNKVVPGLEAD